MRSSNRRGIVQTPFPRGSGGRYYPAVGGGQRISVQLSERSLQLGHHDPEWYSELPQWQQHLTSIEALALLASNIFRAHRVRIVELAARHRPSRTGASWKREA